jgi:hypothetical protein
MLVVGGIVYFALPRVMFDTYMTDQRVPVGLAFMLFACGDLDVHRRFVRRGFVIVLLVLIAGRLLEIDYNWSQLSDSTSEFRSSVRRIAPGSKVFVAYSSATSGEDVRDLGLVHAACIATIERAALVPRCSVSMGSRSSMFAPNIATMPIFTTALRLQPRNFCWRPSIRCLMCLLSGEIFQELWHCPSRVGNVALYPGNCHFWKHFLQLFQRFARFIDLSRLGEACNIDSMT